MKGLFMDAVDDLADVFRRVVRPDDPPVDVNERRRDQARGAAVLCAGYDFVLDDHTRCRLRRCAGAPA